jgi:DedD protein
MDSRAKQRLTGAVILVALFVLLVPELLTGPKSGGTPVETADEEGMRRYTIDLDAPTGSEQPMSAPAPAPAVALPPVAANPMGDAPERAQPGESARAESPAPAPAAATATPMPAARNAPANPAPTVAAPRAVPQPAPPATVTRGGFAVQLGSFGSKDNAERLVRDMNSKGFSAFIAPTTRDARELYQVRVGPTRDRASAEALAAQLRRMGQAGTIIVPIS